MNHTKVEAIYAIRCKATGEYVRANGKGCWLSVSALKSSWRNSWGYSLLTCQTFGEESEYEVVDLLKLIEHQGNGLDSLHSKLEDMESFSNERIASVEDRLRASLTFPSRHR